MNGSPKNLAQWAKIVIELSKIRISQLVALSTLTGYIIATGRLSFEIVLPTMGIFLLACGSAALNQFQERKIDKFMPRTRIRPLPSGRVTPSAALIIAFSLMTIGAGVVFFSSNMLAMLLGLLTGVWYNGVYTPLKQKTTMAVIPGALIGAIPPAVGWVVGGRSLADHQLWAVAFFFFIWQIPHFWLLLLRFGKQYEAAGFPSLTRSFSVPQLARITFMWILATAAACIVIPLFGSGHSLLLILGLFLAAIWLVWSGAKLIRNINAGVSFGFAFKDINIYMMLVMAMLSLDRLLNLPFS